LNINEIRSVIKSELRRAALHERARSNDPSLELSLILGDAVLDSVRGLVVRGSRDPMLVRLVTAIIDERLAADQTVERMFHDADFRTDLVSLVASLLKRAKA
jgi:hypothetical protein